MLDIGSRRVVGFSLSEHHDAAGAYHALAMAVAVRGGDVAGVVLHTDGGGEYTAREFRAACTRLGVVQSMGRPGSALDNAAIEAFHSTLTFGLLRLETFPTKPAARRRVAAWIDEYNRERRHSALAMRSPLEFEHAHRSGSDAAVPGRNSLPPSSPVSRPSPPGGLRPALTPAAGGGATTAQGRRRKTASTRRST